MPPLRFGRYVVVDLVGEGGMGAVYRARDERLGRVVALKVVRGTGGATKPTDEAVARLLREARAVAALTHPNVVAIHDVGDEDGVPFIAMELVEGTSLRRLIAGAASIDQRLDWLRQVADALAAAHALGIVHRDIKPDNVVIHGDGRAKVLDFGLARATSMEGDGAADAATVSPGLGTITREGAAIGTPAYMAPEQLCGDPIDGRCDQFAWGVTAFEVLSGKLPWRPGLTPAGLLAAILAAAPLRLTVEGVPAAIGDVVARAMRADPGARFASMVDLISALDDARRRPLETAPPAPTPTDGADADVSDFESARTEAMRHTHRVAANRSDAEEAAASAARAAAGGSVLRSPWPWLAAPVVVGCAILVAVFGRTPERGSGPAPSASASASVLPATRTILGEPPPATTQDAEALALYRKARLLQHGCDWVRAGPLFDQAAAKAPDLVEAHLWSAITALVVGGYLPNEAARASFQQAVDERHRLPPRERLVLEVYEPIIQRDPADWPRAVERAGQAAASNPKDAELQLMVGALRAVSLLGDPLPAVQAACELDPEYADAWQIRITSEALHGDFAAAARAIEECHRLGPSSVECSGSAQLVYSFIGRCVDAERESRRTMGTPVGGYRPWLLLEQRRPRAEVEEAMRAARAASPGTLDISEPTDALLLALEDGQFDEAQRLARSLIARYDQDLGSFEVQKWGALIAFTLAAEEAGTLRAVEAEVRRHLDTRATWAGVPTPGASALLDVVGIFRRNGLMHDFDLEGAREELRRRHAGAVNQSAAIWATVDLHVGMDAAAARAAMRHKPASLEEGELLIVEPLRGTIGVALYRAGETQAAMHWLERAAGSCMPWTWSPNQIEARGVMTDVLRDAGDVAGACRIQEEFLRRWGKAKPRSKTADEARERIKELACGKPPSSRP